VVEITIWLNNYELQNNHYSTIITIIIYGMQSKPLQ
jgi:hypothetical protein